MSIEENKRIVRRYFEEFHSQRALSIADEIMSGEMREGALRLARMLTTAFPDYQLTVSHQIAEGDTVTTIWTARGTHQEDWMSPIGAIAPTGKPVTWSGSTTVRLRDGLMADVIATNWDHLGILQQMGAAPATAPRPGDEAEHFRGWQDVGPRIGGWTTARPVVLIYFWAARLAEQREEIQMPPTDQRRDRGCDNVSQRTCWASRARPGLPEAFLQPRLMSHVR